MGGAAVHRDRTADDDDSNTDIPLVDVSHKKLPATDMRNVFAALREAGVKITADEIREWTRRELGRDAIV